jgi:hypothetical protein
MFAGMRGSVNYVANVAQDLTPYTGEIRIQRLTDTTASGDRRGTSATSQNTGTTNSAFAAFLLQNSGYQAYSTAGAAFTNSQTNGTVAWNQPQMSGVSINYTDPTYSIPGNGNDQTDKECSYMQILIKQQTANTSTDTLTVTTYAGSGPDFHCLWYLCCPTLDYYATLPTPN